MTDPIHLSPDEILHRRTGHEAFTFHGGPLGCLLIHGLTGTAEEMRYLGDCLNRRRGFTVHGVLLAGHGQDPQDFERSGWPAWYQSAEEGLARLGEISSPCFVVGFSMGALLAIRLAVAHGSGIQGLALLATPLFVNRHKTRLLVPMVQVPFAKGWLQRKAASLSMDSLPLRTDLTPVQASYAQLKWLVRREASLVRQPALLVHSRKDPTVPWENTALIEKILSSSQTRTVFLREPNHVLTLGLERDRVVDEIAGFFLSA